jgi:DNA-binding HxlR family transcriptional regulator
VLSNRLKRLVAEGVLEKNPYQARPVRYDYRLTAKGRDFAPAMVGLKDWGKKHMPIRKAAG